MHRFFEDSSSLLDGKIHLQDKNIKHFKVLRISEDEKFEIVIDDLVYIVKAILIDSKGVICEIVSKNKCVNESNIKINLYQGLPKSDKLELIIQKCTELGVNSIIPFNSSRTIVKWNDKKEEKKLRRYMEIAEAASKQSKRCIIPEIKESISFEKMCEELKDKTAIVAYENRGKSLKEVLNELKDDEINIIIGAEGGFSEEEINMLEDINSYVINLGNRILRTETAAISLVSLIQYDIGDMNK